jgi:hypothetical protein
MLRSTPNNWVSDGRLALTDFNRMWKWACRMRFDRNIAIPTTVEDYVKFKIEIAEALAEEEHIKMTQNGIALKMAAKQKRKLATPFPKTTFSDPNIGVLGQRSIWCRGWRPTPEHMEAPWPSCKELKEEGDERNTSLFGRFLPIPRVPGNETVVYKQKSWNTVETFDEVMPVPRLCGMINIKMYGFTELQIDDNGIPFDDNSLSGNEYLVPDHPHNKKSSTKVESTEYCLEPLLNADNFKSPTTSIAGEKKSFKLNPNAKEYICNQSPKPLFEDFDEFDPEIVHVAHAFTYNHMTGVSQFDRLPNAASKTSRTSPFDNAFGHTRNTFSYSSINYMETTASTIGNTRSSVTDFPLSPKSTFASPAPLASKLRFNPAPVGAERSIKVSIMNPIEDLDEEGEGGVKLGFETWNNISCSTSEDHPGDVIALPLSLAELVVGSEVD